MTKEEILSMPAGKEMDLLIHNKIMGGGKWPYWCKYSVTITAAWEVFIQGLLQFGNASISANMEDYGRGAILQGRPEEVMTVIIGDYQVTDEICLAICRATLLAMIEAD